MEYLKVYERENELITNGEKGLSRKMSALRSFYNYYYKHQIITKNPTLLVDMPKLHDKAIIRLDTDEVALLLDFVHFEVSQYHYRQHQRGRGKIRRGFLGKIGTVILLRPYRLYPL